MKHEAPVSEAAAPASGAAAFDPLEEHTDGAMRG